MAREFLIVDRTKERPGLGLHQLTITGITHFNFDKNDKQRITTETAQLFLKKLGNSLEHIVGSVKILRS